MFVKINPLLGSNTDPRNRTVNVMRAIRAVATANAGTTPECYVIRDPAGTIEATNNMITVISNDEAGGWIADTSSANSLPANDTYVAACTQPYHIHLYSPTGKATWPYKTFTYRTNATYNFNNSFVQYPMSTVYFGIANTTAWNSTYNGISSGDVTGNTTANLCDWNGSWNAVSNTTLGPTLSSTIYPFPFSYSFGEFYLAVTQDYLIGVQPNTYMVYCGTRFTQAWEDDYSDNPPAVGFYHTRLNSPQGIWGWTRYMTTSNTAVLGPTAIQHRIRDNSTNISGFTNSYSHPVHPISGVNRYLSSPSGATIQYGDRHSTRMFTWSASQPAAYIPTPLFYSYGHAGWNGNITVGNWSTGTQGSPYAPVYDSDLQLFVPPAVPMIYQFYGNWFNGGGRLKGIYKSLSGSNTFIGQYAVTDQDFNVTEEGGNTQPYRIVSCSPTTQGVSLNMDTFLIRKA